MAKPQPPELNSTWQYDDDPPDPGPGNPQKRIDWAKAQGVGHFMNNGKKKYYNLIRVRP